MIARTLAMMALSLIAFALVVGNNTGVGIASVTIASVMAIVAFIVLIAFHFDSCECLSIILCRLICSQSLLEVLVNHVEFDMLRNNRKRLSACEACQNQKINRNNENDRCKN